MLWLCWVLEFKFWVESRVVDRNVHSNDVQTWHCFHVGNLCSNTDVGKWLCAVFKLWILIVSWVLSFKFWVFNFELSLSYSLVGRNMYYNHVCSLCVYLKHLINTLHKEIKLYEQKCIIIFIHHNPKGRETQKKNQLLTKKLKAYSKLKKRWFFFHFG